MLHHQNAPEVMPAPPECTGSNSCLCPYTAAKLEGTMHVCLDMAWVWSYRTFTNCCQEKVQLGVWSYETTTKCSLGLLSGMNRDLTIVTIIILQGRRTRKRGTSVDQLNFSTFQAGYSTDGPWTPNRLTLFQTAT